MSLFFDAVWFDAKLAARKLDRTALAIAVGIEPTELHRIFTHEREPTAEELAVFANVLGSDLVEVTLKSGVAPRATPEDADSGDRISDIEARLDAIDTWLAEFEASKKTA
ncbi:helix-turn-helix transcriptional regulator [Terricaulis sp.]|jgi:hypothetical protein|uniref:helix-turn-helix domain-containing protein n=1 Tax=Terricaulis sp. TaxID=2768686 RepID=UPI002AC41A59|nr:helix-turn-helix transcriptional regulator [Terricaulis sp.]MDZ4691625.1 helix-turn-helix transcriptional regulator [Terricaulis sp.]